MVLEFEALESSFSRAESKVEVMESKPVEDLTEYKLAADIIREFKADATKPSSFTCLVHHASETPSTIIFRGLAPLISLVEMKEWSVNAVERVSSCTTNTNTNSIIA